MGYCIKCGERWPEGEKRMGHCVGCHRDFNSDAAFDRHRVDFKCVDPEDVGLVMNEKGYWVTSLYPKQSPK